ncbi:hypothetical protein BH10PSE16_BH10PSE16_00990 [soil metagenome]
MNEEASQPLNLVNGVQLEGAPLPKKSRKRKRLDNPLTVREKKGIARLKWAQSLKMVGERLREARVDLNAMTLTYAADKLGCENPSQLSKIENGHAPAPNWMVLAAAKLYQVSADFLLGAASDWEYSARMTQEREVGRFQAEEAERNVLRQTNLNMVFHDELDWASGAIVGMAFSIEEITETLKRVSEINVELWQEVRGGAKLAGDVERALQLVAPARAGLKRFKRPGLEKLLDKRADDLRESIRSLAKLDLLDYYHSRRRTARVFDVPVSILDKLVRAEQNEQRNALLLKSQFSLDLSNGR